MVISNDLTLPSPNIATALAILVDAPLPPTRLIVGIPMYPVPELITRTLVTLPLET